MYFTIPAFTYPVIGAVIGGAFGNAKAERDQFRIEKTFFTLIGAFTGFAIGAIISITELYLTR